MEGAAIGYAACVTEQRKAAPCSRDLPTLQWFWGINTVMIDATAGAGMSGYAASLEEAQTRFRPAFDRWLALAVAIPLSDLKRAVIDRNLKAIGLR